jgi:alkylation response protein AidB-like acyl-CoA dehydrogenase
MHFRPDPELVRFRQNVREFLSSGEARGLRQRNPSTYHPSREDVAAWTKVLYARGWSAPNWPAEYGGTGWSIFQQSIFAEECYLANMPRTHVQGLQMVGPVIYTFGSDQQKDRFLGPILRGEQFWAQGFSEPGAGSDLASLRTRADRDGDCYVVNGQKIWTSSAMDADYIFCLVRTATTDRPQRGISFLLVGAHSPGLTIRPIHSIDDAYGLNEVFFDNVRVPAENLVGEQNDGWSYAKFLLGNERTGGAADLPYAKKTLARLRRIAAQPYVHGSMDDYQGFAARLAALEAEVCALDFSVIRLLSNSSAGNSSGGNPALASIIKIRGAELQQSLSELMVETLGPYGAVHHPDWELSIDPADDEPGPASGGGIAADYMFRRAATIFGGTNEVQRNIVAKLILGL